MVGLFGVLFCSEELGKESLSDALAVFCPKGAADQSGMRSGYVAAAKLRGCYVAVDRCGLRSGYPTV